MFGVLLLPLVTDRRLLMNELEIIKDNLFIYRNAKLVSKDSNRLPLQRPFAGNENAFYSLQEDKWNPKFEHEAAEQLHKRSFFKRFTVE